VSIGDERRHGFAVLGKEIKEEARSPTQLVRGPELKADSRILDVLSG
jgi:hypothetical protein